MSTQDPTVVIGAGILGSSIAAELAARGRTVTVIAGDETAAASSRSLPWLNGGSPTDAAYHALRRAAVERHRALARRPGYTPLYSFAGSLSWSQGDALEPIQGESAPTASGDEIEAASAKRRRLGEDVRLISTRDAVRLEPALRLPPGTDGPVLHVPDEGLVDLRQLVHRRLADAQRHGAVVIRSGAEPRIADADGSPEVVLATGERIRAGNIVIAAGAGSPGLAGQVGVGIPHRSNLGAVVVTDPVARPPRLLLRTTGVTVRALAGGELLLHARSLEDAVARRLPDAEGAIDLAGEPVIAGAVEHLLARAQGVYAGADRIRVREVLAGPRPIPGDGYPVVGRIAERVWIAFAHSAATLGPLLAETLADEVAGDLTSENEANELLRRFRPERFGAAIADSAPRV